MKCLVCGTVIKGRADKKTCSDKCKKAHQRLKGTNKGDTAKGDNGPAVAKLPCSDPKEFPANYGQPDCQCKHCQASRSRANGRLINHGPWKSASQLAANEVNRVSLPGDVDYHGVEGIQRVVASTHLAIAGCV